MVYENFSRIMNEACEAAHENAERHGFYFDSNATLNYLENKDQPKHAETVEMNFVLAQMAKITSEIGEAVHVIQHGGDYDMLGEEMADIVIRTMDLAGYLGIKLGSCISAKMIKNATRPYKHGKIC